MSAPQGNPFEAIERYALRLFDTDNVIDQTNTQAIIDICRAYAPKYALANIYAALWSEAEKECDELRAALGAVTDADDRHSSVSWQARSRALKQCADRARAALAEAVCNTPEPNLATPLQRPDEREP